MLNSHGEKTCTKVLSQIIRIAFIAHDCSLFGAQRSLLSLLLNIDRNKFEPVVIAPYHGPFLDIVQKAGIPCHVVHMSRWIPLVTEKSGQGFFAFLISLPIRIYRLTSLLSRLKVDIVYSNTVVNADAAIAAKLLRVKHIWHLREGVNNSKQVSSYLPPIVLPYIIRSLSSKVIVNSQWLGQHYFGKESEAVVVYNGIDSSELISKNAKSMSLRKELGLPDNCRLIVSIGALDPCKRHDVFIQASEIISSCLDDVYYLIVGLGYDDCTRKLKSLAEGCAIPEKILFLGWRDDVARILSEIDVIVIASDQEGFGRVVVEGMALKKPVVSTRCGGPEEIIVNGETGYLVPISDPEALAEHVMLLLNNDQQRSAMGLAGYKRMQEHFSEVNYVKSIEKILESVATMPH
ncbi:glycosyltransferase family 4 protein [Geobacter sp. AOG1]|uniref:glycosyltransferase family 4 protein n=1 Tax=Geobacter sp. AOG1 TaxID=1566346 RepID=UPI001CC4D761|nr:glycosyltransferase family 4 protein [Geobacter sp. AOG1]GFE58484.1 glycosyl transferase group 1 [Geobacter sp. AOG1]